MTLRCIMCTVATVCELISQRKLESSSYLSQIVLRYQRVVRTAPPAATNTSKLAFIIAEHNPELNAALDNAWCQLVYHTIKFVLSSIVSLHSLKQLSQYLQSQQKLKDKHLKHHQQKRFLAY